MNKFPELFYSCRAKPDGTVSIVSQTEQIIAQQEFVDAQSPEEIEMVKNGAEFMAAAANSYLDFAHTAGCDYLDLAQGSVLHGMYMVMKAIVRDGQPNLALPCRICGQIDEHVIACSVGAAKAMLGRIEAIAEKKDS